MAMRPSSTSASTTRRRLWRADGKMFDREGRRASPETATCRRESSPRLRTGPINGGAAHAARRPPSPRPPRRRRPTAAARTVPERARAHLEGGGRSSSAARRPAHRRVSLEAAGDRAHVGGRRRRRRRRGDGSRRRGRRRGVRTRRPLPRASRAPSTRRAVVALLEERGQAKQARTTRRPTRSPTRCARRLQRRGRRQAPHVARRDRSRTAGDYARRPEQVDDFTEAGGRPPRAPHRATELAEYPEADAPHEALTAMGIVLDTRARTWKKYDER